MNEYEKESWPHTTGHVQYFGDTFHDYVHARVGRLHLATEIVQQLGLIVQLVLHGLRDVLQTTHSAAYQIDTLVLLSEQLLKIQNKKNNIKKKKQKQKH